MEKNISIEAVLTRLKKIEGQVRGIIKMIEEHKDCEDVLIQISGARKAMHRAGQIILEIHLNTCVLEGINDGNANETIKKLSESLDLFGRLN